MRSANDSSRALRKLSQIKSVFLALQLATGGGLTLYDVLWGAVFGFATLNILGLLARRFEPGRTRMTLGELLAITVAVIAVLMIGWELLFFFHVLPIHLDSR